MDTVISSAWNAAADQQAGSISLENGINVKRFAPKQTDRIIILGDLAIAVFASTLYYTALVFDTSVPAVSISTAIIWLNLTRVLGTYVYHSRNSIDPDILFKLFVGSNFLFLPALEFAAPIGTMEYHSLFFLLMAFTAFSMDHRKIAIVAAWTIPLSLISSVIINGFSPQRHFIQLLFMGAFFSFLHTFVRKVKSSQAKHVDAMDNLNQRTWELEMAHSETEVIHNTATDIAGTINVAELTSKILMISTKWLGAKSCKVFRISTDGMYFLLLGEATLDSSEIYESPKRVVPGEFLSSIGSESFGASALSVRSNEKRVLVNEERTRALITLTTRSTPIGGIFLESEDAEGFQKSQERRLIALGSSASMAMENALLMQKTKELAIIDELTGMYNFRFFKDKLHTEIQRATRYKLDLSVLMLDIDFFKKINDTYGHQVGNMALQQLSGLLRRCLREVDILSRYGGEEFAAILPQTGIEDATMVAERIRSEVERSTFEGGPRAPEVRFTVSIGVETFNEEYAKDPRLFLERADNNLFAAKKAGRNKVVIGKPHITPEANTDEITSPFSNYEP